MSRFKHRDLNFDDPSVLMAAPAPVKQESTILDKLDPKPKKPAGKTRGFYLDVETIELLSTVSRKLGCNKSELVNHVLKETLKDFL